MSQRAYFWAIIAVALATCAGVTVILLMPEREGWPLSGREPADLPSVDGGSHFPKKLPVRWVLRVDRDGALSWGGEAVPDAERDATLLQGLNAAVDQMDLYLGIPDGVLWLNAHRDTPGREIVKILRACITPSVKIWKVWVLVSRADGRAGYIGVFLHDGEYDWKRDSGPGDVTLLVPGGVARINSDSDAVVEVPLREGIARLQADTTIRVRVDAGKSGTWSEIIDLVETIAVGPERTIWVGDVPVQFEF